MVEDLGRVVSKAIVERRIEIIQVTSGFLVAAHQQFVDDTLLFGASKVKEAQEFVRILEAYTAASGQQVSNEKSKIFFLNVRQSDVQGISRVLKFRSGHLLITYLGLPLDRGVKSNIL